jgi:hypothetical protein
MEDVIVDSDNIMEINDMPHWHPQFHVSDWPW